MNSTKEDPLEWLFEQLVNLPPGDREAWIRKNWSGDAELVKQVLSLLEIHDQSISGFLPDPEELYRPVLNEKAQFPVDGNSPSSNENGERGDQDLSFSKQKTVKTSSKKSAVWLGDLTGKTIDSYQILGVIGKGGMGVVYKARDVKLNRFAAIKVLNDKSISHEATLSRFQLEAQASARLKHPNIVNVYGTGTFDLVPYIAMEFIEGRDLGEELGNTPIDPKQAAIYIRKIADALHELHKAGIVHRDIKPANIMIDQHDEPKLMDFGIAKDTATESELNQTTDAQGSPSYMSPEQANFKPERNEPLTDIYSLGAALYTCLTGKPPFIGKSKEETVFLVRMQTPVAPRELNSAIPRDLETICLKCLEKEPTDRILSAQMLSDELTRFLKNKSIQTKPPRWWERFRKWCQRNPSIAALILVFLIGFVTTAYFYLDAKSEWTRAEENLKSSQENEKLAKEKQKEAERSEKKALWNLYVSRLFPMNEAWNQQDYGRLEYLLNESLPQPGEPDFRGWEWYFFQDQVRRASNQIVKSSVTYTASAPDYSSDRVAVATWERIEIRNVVTNQLEHRFPQGAYKLSWSRDGNWLASFVGSTITIWSIQDGDRLRTIHFGDGFLDALSCSPDGSMVACAHSNGQLMIWDSTTGQKVKSIKLPSEVTVKSMGWHPSEQLLAAGLVGGFSTLIDIETEDQIWTEHSGVRGGMVESVEWSADGTSFLASHSPDPVLWAKDGTKLQTFEGHQGMVSDISWSEDGEQIVSGGVDQTVRLWDAGSGDLLKSSRVLNAPALQVSFCDAGKSVVMITDHEIRLQASGEQPQHEIWEIPASGGSFEWSPDGKLLAVPFPYGYVRLYNQEGKSLKTLFHLKSPQDMPLQYLAWSPDQTMIAAKGYRTRTIIWDVKTGKTVKMYDPPGDPNFGGRGLSWSPNGKYLSMASRRWIHLCETAPWSTLFTLDERSRIDWNSKWSPDGKHLAIASGKYGMSVWNVDKRELLCEHKCDSSVRTPPAWNPKAEVVVVGTTAGSLFWYSVSERQLLHDVKGHKSAVVSVEWSPDGHRLASADEQGTVIIWDGMTPTPLIKFTNSPLKCIRWSPCGNLLSTGGVTREVHHYGSRSMDMNSRHPTHIDRLIQQAQALVE